MGAEMTTSTYVSGRHGRLTVRFDRQATEDEVADVGRAANDKVMEDVEIAEFEMDRSEAENHFGQKIYDAFPVPAGVERLRIVLIQDWNANCCIERHVETTGQIGQIAIGKPRFRNAKRELEIEFDIVG